MDRDPQEILKLAESEAQSWKSVEKSFTIYNSLKMAVIGYWYFIYGFWKILNMFSALG